jgi:hypothetical protein
MKPYLTTEQFQLNPTQNNTLDGGVYMCASADDKPLTFVYEDDSGTPRLYYVKAFSGCEAFQNQKIPDENGVVRNYQWSWRRYSDNRAVFPPTDPT